MEYVEKMDFVDAGRILFDLRPNIRYVAFLFTDGLSQLNWRPIKLVNPADTASEYEYAD